MVAKSPTHILGLDLHGTLLEPGEIVRHELVEPVAAALERLKGRVARFLCTGNDLDFVRRKVPAPILERIDGHVLETGCSLSRDGVTEEVLTTEAELETIRGLEARLREARFGQVNYFAHRLTTISMFCDLPREFHAVVADFVDRSPFAGAVHVTYSSVAVDILPQGYHKHRGLRAVALGRATIGVADSMNDRALLEEADYAFAPANLAPELEPLLARAGREIVSLDQTSGLLPGAVVRASQRETEGVIEILDFLDRVIV